MDRATTADWNENSCLPLALLARPEADEAETTTDLTILRIDPLSVLGSLLAGAWSFFNADSPLTPLSSRLHHRALKSTRARISFEPLGPSETTLSPLGSRACSSKQHRCRAWHG